MKHSIQTIPFFNGTIKLIPSIDGTCRQCVLQKYCGEKPVIQMDDINCMSENNDSIYVWATKPTKYQLFRYTIAKSILDGRPLGTIVVKWWTGAIYRITNIELKTKWSRPYFIVTYKCKENNKYVEKKEAFNKYGCSKYGYSQLMLHLTF